MIALEIDAEPAVRMALRLRGLAGQIQRPEGIMRTIAEGVEHQTKRRIEHEKTAPDGAPWRPWSARYARTRKAPHSLLMDTWSMVRDKLHSKNTATTATVYDTAPYAGVHQTGSRRINQTGSRRIHARPFLGLSDDNVRDLEGWIAPALEGLAAEALKGAKAQ